MERYMKVHGEKMKNVELKTYIKAKKILFVKVMNEKKREKKEMKKINKNKFTGPLNFKNTLRDGDRSITKINNVSFPN